MKIIVSKNGPFLVIGSVPLYLKHIVTEGGFNILKTIKKLKVDDNYALCRCGETTNPPFCTGIHTAINFDGTETAGISNYTDRANLLVGETIDLLDDDRCAFARFCHKQHGDIWSLVETSSDSQNRKEAITAAGECPTGRLVVLLKSGDLIEEQLTPGISIVEDLSTNSSAGIFVTGKIPIESADGEQYEIRNQEALCRCGTSSLKPFCDASHVNQNT